jgi:hypothetical protein
LNRKCGVVGPSYIMGSWKLSLEYFFLDNTYPNGTPERNLDLTDHIPVIMKIPKY